jgi:hypothetical protein
MRIWAAKAEAGESDGLAAAGILKERESLLERHNGEIAQLTEPGDSHC